MISDEEFLNGMWKKVSILECEEMEKMRAKDLNRKITFKRIYILMFSIVGFSILIFFAKYMEGAVYPLVIGILSGSFIYETLSSRILEENIYENNSIKFE